jgi:pimeloyl-ACP methyl ester carboxylesterase
MGLEGLTGGTRRADWFIRMIEGAGTWPRGTGEFVAESFMKASVKNPAAIVHLLRGQQDTPPEALAALTLPVDIICGADDRDNGSAPELAALLPDAVYREIPGNHMGSVTKPDLADAMLAALARS